MLDTFPFDRRTAADILGDPETSATVLHIIMLAAYGDELHGDAAQGIDAMDPIECWVRVEEDFRVRVPEENENKINALMFAISTEAFYEDPLAFNSICNALYSGDLGDLVSGAIEDLTLPELLWGIYEVELNRGDSQDFDAPVDRFINEVIAEEAEDMENPDLDRIVSYYEKFVEEQRDDMLIQLKTLGVDESIIAQILKADLTPAQDDE